MERGKPPGPPRPPNPQKGRDSSRRVEQTQRGKPKGGGKDRVKLGIWIFFFKLHVLKKERWFQLRWETRER